MTPEQRIARLEAQIQQMQKPAQADDDPLAGITRFQLDPDELTGAGFSPQQIKIFEKMLPSLVLEAVQTSGVLSKKALAQFQQTIDPVLGYARAYGQDQFFNKMYEKAPTLKGHDKLVRQYLPSLQNDPNLPQDEDQVFEYVANKFKETYKDSIPSLAEVAANGNASPSSSPAPAGSRPAATASTVGGSSSGATAEQVPAWMRP